jgi:hypothetical protein
MMMMMMTMDLSGKNSVRNVKTVIEMVIGMKEKKNRVDSNQSKSSGR